MSSIEVDGMDEFMRSIDNMTLSPGEETTAMRTAIELPFKAVMGNVPILKGITERSIKKTVIKDGLGTTGIISVGTWTAMFTEFGTSESKSNIGWFSIPIAKTTTEFLEALAAQLLAKAK